MKQNLLYHAPETKALDLEPQSVICGSGDINSMIVNGIIDGDEDFE